MNYWDKAKSEIDLAQKISSGNSIRLKVHISVESGSYWFKVAKNHDWNLGQETKQPKPQ